MSTQRRDTNQFRLDNLDTRVTSQEAIEKSATKGYKNSSIISVFFTWTSNRKKEKGNAHNRNGK